ncbi:MAG: hypothetical protein SCARUB_03137 [Candidatus Scalindua rubra]|uniref:3-keto-disaccharide hydrolase domain-containing protein n=1 Tax=Candidatus Scalindua rubra TaxID=1872076 RepID=A0A1E3X7Z1_9BACT|nr:MAG: hypothetical protein SCARUB_03137 [Candidatus Scalindua rubra]
MKKFIISALVSFFFLFAVGCGEGYEYGESEKDEHYKGEQIAYKGNVKLWNFDSDENGKMPNDFSNQMTGKGGLGKWEAIKDDTAPSLPNVIAQTSQEYLGYHFSMAINEKETYDDFELIVKFKGVKGREDQGGGPVWRYQDANNYYIARANPLENNFRVYKVVDGNRLQMDSARLKVTTNEWHMIKIIARMSQIQCFYDGRPYLETTDNTFQKGKIGLWTKTDAVTYFDDLEVRPIKQGKQAGLYKESNALVIDETHTKTSSINLRTSYRDLSVSQVQSMSNISIRKKERWGFYGHSTINHSYNLKSIGGDKVVIDHDTGLMWHQSGSDKRMKWNEAKNWTRDLNSRGYAGYHDWRLPTVEEAASLLESRKKRNGLYIDSIFSNKQEWIWTGDKHGSEGAWGVSFGLGSVIWSDFGDDDTYVRPVRSGTL